MSAPPPDIEGAYRRYFPLLRGKCRRMLRTDAEAEEVAQDAFLRLVQSGLVRRGAFSDSRQVTAWLYRTSTRLAIDRLRARRTEPFGDAVPQTAAVASAEDSVLARHALQRLAAQLDWEPLAASILCRFDGLSQSEAASVLGCSERTLRRHLSRCDEAIAKFHAEETA